MIEPTVESASSQSEQPTRFIQQLGPPPRTVPTSVKVKLLLNSSAMLGAFLFGFGMVFVWIFLPMSLPFDDWKLNDHAKTVPATITSVKKTEMSEGGSRKTHRKGTPVYEYSFQFQIDGKIHRGRCYSSGKRFKTGDVVEAEYLPTNPNICRIKGTRSNVFGPGPMFVVIFPLFGAIFFIVSAARGRTLVSMLVHGQPTEASVISVADTKMRVNNVPVLKYELQLTDPTGMQRKITYRSAEPPQLQAGQTTQVLWDPITATKAIPAAKLTKRLKLDDAGRIIEPSPLVNALRIGLVGLCFLGHAAYALQRLL